MLQWFGNLTKLIFYLEFPEFRGTTKLFQKSQQYVIKIK